MLIPLRHENMEAGPGRLVSIALVLINLVVFLVTHGQIEDQNPRNGEVRAHILLLAAMHPELTMPPAVEAEYENLSAAYPAERQSLRALMAAGRLALKKLNRPSDALRY